MSQRCPVVRGLSFILGGLGAQSTALSSLGSLAFLRQGRKSTLFYSGLGPEGHCLPCLFLHSSEYLAITSESKENCTGVQVAE